MIRTDISNVWCSVSLPELLQNERRIFDAHLALAGGESRTDGLFDWLTLSGAERRAWLKAPTEAAAAIRNQSEILVVVGGGPVIAGARAAIRLLYGRRVTAPRLIFAGDSFSAEDWLDVASALEGHEFSVLLCGQTGREAAPLAVLRGLYRIMEKRYGEKMREHVFVAAPGEKNPMRDLARAEDFRLIAQPTDPAGVRSVLSPAGFLMMSAAAMNSDLLFEGAADGFALCDARNLDNPAWLCAAASVALADKGVRDQVICVPTPAAEELGKWWAKNQTGWSRDGKGVRASAMRLPADLAAEGEYLLDGTDAHCATVLRLPPERRRVTVERLWKDVDGMEDLNGLDFGRLGDRMLDAAQDALTDGGVPFVTVTCEDPMTDDRIGELLYFAEFSSALTAASLGLTLPSRFAAWDLLEKPKPQVAFSRES